ncbi:MAG: hypothetical protein RJA44_97 [Pseudomonadota bacterium]
MLRTLVLLLAAANLLFYGWTHGWLSARPGLDPDAEREPQRLLGQLHPELLQPIALERLAQPASAAEPALCLDAGPFSPAEQQQLIAIAQSSLPEGSWAVLAREVPGSWLVYMGKFANREQMQRKADELRRLGVAFEELRAPPELEPGLVLSRHRREDEARAALQHLAAQRVRTARLITLAPPGVSYALRIAQADLALQNTAVALRERLGGKGFIACRRDEAAGTLVAGGASAPTAAASAPEAAASRP